MKLSHKEEGIISSLAAILVLFSAMWNPIVSASIAFVLLVGYAVYNFMRK